MASSLILFNFSSDPKCDLEVDRALMGWYQPHPSLFPSHSAPKWGTGPRQA